MPEYLSKLQPPPGSRRNRKRVGRGIGSTLGKTSGRGQKGYHSRSGSKRMIGFEGGQMPLQRRLPKRGFFNPAKKQFTLVNLADIERWGLTEVSPSILVESGKLRRLARDGVKVLGFGDLTRAVAVEAHGFSARAREKIAKAGGTANLIGAADEKKTSGDVEVEV